MQIRPYLTSDAQATLDVFLTAVTVTASTHYSPEQIAAWSWPEGRDLGEWDTARRASGTVVAVVDGRIVGFSDVGASGYIDMMFVDPGFGRRGVASALLSHLVARAEEAGIAQLSTDAGLAARPFFERHGFVVVAEQRPVKRGVEMTNFRMTRNLGSARINVRPAAPADVERMARVHVSSWQETYRGLMSDEVLDAPDAIARREHFWTAALTDSRYAANRAAVAEVDGDIVGIAMAGPPEDPEGEAGNQLYLLYLLRTHHGSGAGRRLLEAVLSGDESALLWVADPNPRAQAFYRKQGFEADGGWKVEDSIRSIRMTR